MGYGECGRERFCRDKTRVCRDKTRQKLCSVATKLCLSRQIRVCRDTSFVATKICLSRQRFCRDKHTFVATNTSSYLWQLSPMTVEEQGQRKRTRTRVPQPSRRETYTLGQTSRHSEGWSGKSREEAAFCEPSSAAPYSLIRND